MGFSVPCYLRYVDCGMFHIKEEKVTVSNPIVSYVCAQPDDCIFLFFGHYFLIAHPPDRQLELFFSGRNNDRAPARQTTRTFFPVVIMIVHPPDRRLYLFFSGRNKDCAPARQTTRTFFFSVVVMIAHPPDRRLELFLFRS